MIIAIIFVAILVIFCVVWVGRKQAGNYPPTEPPGTTTTAKPADVTYDIQSSEAGAATEPTELDSVVIKPVSEAGAPSVQESTLAWLADREKEAATPPSTKPIPVEE